MSLLELSTLHVGTLQVGSKPFTRKAGRGMQKRSSLFNPSVAEKVLSNFESATLRNLIKINRLGQH